MWYVNIFSKSHEYMVFIENVKCTMSKQPVAVHLCFGCVVDVRGVTWQDVGRGETRLWVLLALVLETF